MQRPLICLLGMSMTALAQADGGLVLRKSVALTLGAYPTTVSAAATGPALALRLSAGVAGGRTDDGPAVDAASLDKTSRANANVNASVNTNARAEPAPGPAIVTAAPSAPASPIAALVEQARFWASQNRDDLAEEAVRKLFGIAPENLQGLEILGAIHARRRDAAGASLVLERMRRAHADAASIRRVEALMRIDGNDRDALRAMRALARENRNEEAAAAMRRLYPDGPPNEEMTLEYWRMIAAGPDGSRRARAGLQALVRQEPGNQRYRLALDELLTAQAPVDRPALARIIALADAPAYARQARAAWRRAMLALDDSAASIALMRSYLLQEKNDSAVRTRLDRMVASVAARERLLADPAYQAQRNGLALIAAGRIDQAQAPLERAYAGRASDIDLLNGLGLLRMRQGRHAEAETLFQRAAQLDPPQRARWDRMARIARYWGLIAQADTAAEARRFSLAEDRLRAARALDPAEPAAILALAGLYGAQQRPLDAERTYGELLAKDPANTRALEGLVRIHLDRADDDRVAQLLARLDPKQRAALAPAVGVARAARLRTQADALAGAGRIDDAIAALEQAVPLSPDDPWLRFDLGRLYVRRNAPADAARADGLFTTLLARLPASDVPQALYAQALLDDSRDRTLAALETLDHLPQDARAPKITALQRRLWTTLRIRRAAAMADAGRTAQAGALLDDTARATGADPELAPQLARALGQYGGPAGVTAARALLDKVEATQTLPEDWLVQRAEITASFDDDAELAHDLQRARARAPATPTVAARIATLRVTLLARQAAALIRVGDPAAALALLDGRAGDGVAGGSIGTGPVTTPDGTVTGDRRLQLLRADAAFAQQRFDLAGSGYRAVLQRDPTDRDAGLGLIDTLIATGRTDEARTRIDAQQALRSATPEGLTADDTATLASRLIDLKDDAAALALIDAALSMPPAAAGSAGVPVAPATARLLEQASGIAVRANRPDEAIGYLRRSLTATAASRGATVTAIDTTNTRPNITTNTTATTKTTATDDPAAGLPPADGGYRRLAELLDARSTWVAGAIDLRSRSGAAGRSSYAYAELPFEWRRPWRDGSNLFMQGAAVRSSAGTLDLGATGDAARFGSVLLCQPTCTIGGVKQDVAGLGLSAGVERADLRVDIGVTPLGFPVQNLVGGVLTKGDLGPFSWSVDASRRAVTGSVLSYAGARDPRTGALWGGVLANGVRVGLSRDAGGAFGAWSSLGLHRLTGRNVQDNDRMQLMGGGYWRAINEDDRLLTFGMNAMLWRFSENAGEYTLGHGGYYSPQRFASVSLPVTFAQRSARLSYSLRAALSASRSATAEAAYFPTRPDLQSQALALAGTNGIDPRYGASTGRGIGRSVSGAFEYQMDPRLFVGGRFDIDRSTDYAPHRVLFYFRYDLDRSSARPVIFPPEPLVPVSQY